MSLNFDDKKIKKSSFYQDKKINNIETLMLNTLSAIMIMTSLDCYV